MLIELILLLAVPLLKLLFLRWLSLLVSRAPFCVSLRLMPSATPKPMLLAFGADASGNSAGTPVLPFGADAFGNGAGTPSAFGADAFRTRFFDLCASNQNKSIKYDGLIHPCLHWSGPDCANVRELPQCMSASDLLFL